MAIAERDELHWTGSQHGFVCLFFRRLSSVLHNHLPKSWACMWLPVNSWTPSYLETKTDGKADLLKNYINGLHSSSYMFTYLPLELNYLYLSQNCWLKFSFSHSTFGLCPLCSTNTFSICLYGYNLTMSLFKNVLYGQFCIR